MWSIVKKCIMLVLLAVFCSCLSSVGFCSQAADAETVTVSKKDWITLQQNNAAQKKALEKLWTELLEARAARNESNQALLEARSLLEASQMTSDEMMQKFLLLSNESQMQKEEIARLKKDLAVAKTESLTAYESIVKANQYLAATKEEIEAQRAEWQKRENQLERQRLAWQVLFALAVGGGIALAT